ncbi:protein Hook homolog 3-like [Papaver somniferum]|uniref:protein Hook homolog 3-like n=1 Tax=Papaver somniferum TaxID=3469 RepID=UPI000E6FFFBE|nr:protein Hook homolog 3-like [Papaver somniferum]
MGKRGKCDDYVKIEKTNVVKKRLNQRKYINQLKREIRCLERANKTYKTTAIELETWKENFIENEKELEAYRKMNSNGSLVEKKLDSVVHEDKLKGEFLVNDEQNDYKIKYSELLLRMKRLEDDQIQCSMSEYHKVVQLETEKKELGIGNCGLQEEVNVWEKVIQACKVKSNELSALLDEKKMEYVVLEDKCKDLRLSKLVVDDELKNYKTKCMELEERITQVEADQRVICEKEKKGQEQNLFLLHENGKLVQLKTENRELELGKCRLQDEINNWSKKFQEMETQFQGLPMKVLWRKLN